MVGRGLIGSRNSDTAAITEQVKAALNGGRSVTLAAGGPAQHSKWKRLTTARLVDGSRDSVVKRFRFVKDDAGNLIELSKPDLEELSARAT